jgi:hypothetical protein
MVMLPRTAKRLILLRRQDLRVYDILVYASSLRLIHCHNIALSRLDLRHRRRRSFLVYHSDFPPDVGYLRQD